MQICYGCMHEFEDSLTVCPACGFRVGTPPVYDDCLRHGTLIGGRYISGKAIGRGGFGITYLALDTHTGKRVVIKEYLPEGFASRSSDQKTVSYTSDRDKYVIGMNNAIDGSRAISEYDYLESVEKYTDCISENGTVYIVREYFEGETIREHIENKGVFSYQETVETIIPVLRTLSGLHEKGFVHGNINPDSIIICTNGRVKLVDLGLRAESLYALRRGFAPSEQYESSAEITGATDVYSACAVIYYMLTGIVPPDSRVMGTQHDNFVPISDSVFISESVEKVIMQGLEPDVSLRTVTADDVADAMIMREKSGNDGPAEGAAYVTENTDVNSGSRSRYRKLLRKKSFRKIRKYLPGLISFGAVIAVLLIAVLIVAVCMLIKNGKTADDTDATTESSVAVTAAEDTGKVIFTPTQAIEKYNAFLNDENFRETYPDVYAVKVHNIDYYPEDKTLPSGITTFDYASVAPYYYDLDIDGTNEMVYAVRLDSSTKYVSVYIFDIDDEGNVFEGGRISYNDGAAENLSLCDSKANGITYYHFLRYTSSAYDGKSENPRSFECLYYDGSKLNCGASGGQNKKVTAGDGDYSADAAYTVTGPVYQINGVIWDPTAPQSVRSVYAYDDDNYVTSSADYTVITSDAFETVWSRNITAADLKCEFMKNLQAVVVISEEGEVTPSAPSSVSFTVTFKGPEVGRDLEFTWKVNGREIPILYTDGSKNIVYSDEVSKEDFGSEYKVELYQGENRYSSCTITLDEDGNPVYHYGKIELIWVPDVTGKSSDDAVSVLKAAGFTSITTESVSIVGLKNIRNIGIVESQSVAANTFCPVGTTVKLYVYSL